VKTDIANTEALIQLTFRLGLEIHRDGEPGFIESVYARVLAVRLRNVQRRHATYRKRPTLMTRTAPFPSPVSFTEFTGAVSYA
jgi:hypothetical protein